MNDFSISPMVIVDFRVMVYHIESQFKTIAINHNRASQKEWLKAAWAIVVNRGFTGLPYSDHTIVIVDDSSPYWREGYLRDRGFPEYKDGRTSKSSDWYFVQEVGKEYICHPNSPIHFLSFEGYEADDIASALVRCKAPRLVLLHTVDSDWSGLINDGALDKTPLNQLIFNTTMIEPTVVWVNSNHWTPRIRDTKRLYEWANKRLKVQLDNPAHLWEVKKAQGDKSDNLVVGSPLEVIDLFNPPAEYDLLNNPDTKQMIESVAHSYSPNSNLDHLTRSVKWFRQEGFSIPAIDFNKFALPTKKSYT